MRVERFEWEGPRSSAIRIRGWASELAEPVDVGEIFHQVVGRGDAGVLDLTNRFDATVRGRDSLGVDPALATAALARLEPGLRSALDAAAANIQAVAQAQVGGPPIDVDLPQGQTVTLRDLPVGSAGVYAPGGHAAYPSSVLMCAIPARLAGVERIALASPPQPDGELHPLVLAAAALCEVDEIYAMGGAQAIFALAYGTDSVASVNVIAGPGNAWVREAKRAVSGVVGIDSLAGPSELMIVAGHDSELEWAALDLCAQAEHGAGGALVVAAVEQAVLDGIAAATERAAGERPGVGNAPLALVQVPDLDAAVELANAFAPEHLELLCDEAALLAERVTTAGCVFAGRHSATAFGDYVAGSNHVLPTGGAGRFSGPLGPDVFRRKIATVEISADAAAKLAPHVKTLAEAEGFPVHGESAMIRAEENR